MAMKASIMNTWLSPAVPEPLRLRRWLLLGCFMAGLIQKPLISFAWDVISFTKVMTDLSVAGAGPTLMGGTAILLRQIFAEKGQELVGKMASRLCKQGRVWTKLPLEQLRDGLWHMEPGDAGKRKGRVAQFSGPVWVESLLADPGFPGNFARAAEVVGKLFDISADAEGLSFGDTCQELQGKSKNSKTRSAKLPGIAVYGVPHLVRECVAARVSIDGVAVPISDADFMSHLRDMHDDRTSAQFAAIGVSTGADARAMLRAVLGFARSFHSYDTARRWASLDLLDLPCQVCESGGVLSAVAQHRRPAVKRPAAALEVDSSVVPRRAAAAPHPRGHGVHRRPAQSLDPRGSGVPMVSSPRSSPIGSQAVADAEVDDVTWLLGRLPGSHGELLALGGFMKGMISAVPGKGDGYDRQCAGAVTKAWLNTEPGPVADSLLACIRGRIDVPFTLPPYACQECSAMITRPGEMHADLRGLSSEPGS